MNTQPFRPLTDDEKNTRLGVWADRITAIAAKMCTHSVPGTRTAQGHPSFPCNTCTKIVRFVTGEWAGIFSAEQSRVIARYREDKQARVVTLRGAYRAVGGATIEPDWSLATDDYGPL